MKITKYIVIALLVLLPIPSFADEISDTRDRFDFLYGEHTLHEKFYYDLIISIKVGDKSNLAKLNHYPLSVYSSSKVLIIENEKQFIEQYDIIITDRIKDEVNKSAFGGLRAKSDGIMIGRGHIWFTGICVGDDPSHNCDKFEVKVITYNTDAPKSP